MTVRRSVLVVGRDVGAEESLCGILGDAGYKVDTVSTGMEALSKLSTGVYGALVVDPRLPDMSWSEFLISFRENFPHVVCITLTEDPSLIVTGRINVQLRKPVDPLELLGAVRMGTLVRLDEPNLVVAETAREYTCRPFKCESGCQMLQALRAEKESLEEAYHRERHISELLQRTLITEICTDVPGCQVAARYQPALEEAEVGGDFYDVFKLDGERIAFLIGDVAGKGLPAAVHTAMAKYMLRAYAHEGLRPQLAVARLNDALCDYSQNELFITLFYGVLDTRSYTLTYVDAGQDQPVMYSRRDGRVRSLNVTGPAAGITKGQIYDQDSTELADGDVLLLYTDGIIDARKKGRFFGSDGVAQVLFANAYSPEQQIVDAVFDAATRFGGGRLRDDAAVVVVRVREGTKKWLMVDGGG